MPISTHQNRTRASAQTGVLEQKMGNASSLELPGWSRGIEAQL
jgi:hypothetical protein